MFLSIWSVSCNQALPGSNKANEPTALSSSSGPDTQVGLRKPEALLRSEVLLDDLERVIGVSVGNQHRAYLIKAFSAPVHHDFLNNVPLTVTYCQLSSCARVFTSSSSELLEVAAGGWRDGQLALIWNGQQFNQRDKKIPLEDHPFVVTTWKDWTGLHPDSDVYIGSLDE